MYEKTTKMKEHLEYYNKLYREASVKKLSNLDKIQINQILQSKNIVISDKIQVGDSLNLGDK